MGPRAPPLRLPPNPSQNCAVAFFSQRGGLGVLGCTPCTVPASGRRHKPSIRVIGGHWRYWGLASAGTGVCVFCTVSHGTPIGGRCEVKRSTSTPWRAERKGRLPTAESRFRSGLLGNCWSSSQLEFSRGLTLRFSGGSTSCLSTLDPRPSTQRRPPIHRQRSTEPRIGGCGTTQAPSDHASGVISRNKRHSIFRAKEGDARVQVTQPSTHKRGL